MCDTSCTDSMLCLDSALKLLSVDPQNYPDAPREGIRRILEQLTGKKHPRTEKLDTSRISSIRMGPTVSCHACRATCDCVSRCTSSWLAMQLGYLCLHDLDFASAPNKSCHAYTVDH